MKYNKVKIIKITFIFLLIMLFFTIISKKVDYMMTPEVDTTQTKKGELLININTNGTIIDSLLSFNLNMTKESLLQVGDSVQAEFVNGEYKKEAYVIDKRFNSDYQTMEYTCTLDGSDIYEGQDSQIQFDYSLGAFNMILPRESIIYEGENTFVYYIENVNTVTGEKYIIQKIEVEILGEDDFNVAISSNINERHMVVQYSSKPIIEGAKVRVGI